MSEPRVGDTVRMVIEGTHLGFAGSEPPGTIWIDGPGGTVGLSPSEKLKLISVEVVEPPLGPDAIGMCAEGHALRREDGLWTHVSDEAYSRDCCVCQLCDDHPRTVLYRGTT